jgi:hypothetical protein
MVKQIKQKKQESLSLAWVSRFWAHYNKLPEPFKKGFFDLARSIAKESGEQGREVRHYGEADALVNKFLGEHSNG